MGIETLCNAYSVVTRAEYAEDTTESVHYLSVGHRLNYRWSMDLDIC